MTESVLQPERLRCEYLEEPAGLDEHMPLLSWALSGEGRSRRQSAYQILVAASPEALEREHGDVWNSGKVSSDETVAVPYDGPELRSGGRCYWRVRAWDEQDVAGPYSATASWSMGLLDESDWEANWIGLGSAPEAAKEAPSGEELDDEVTSKLSPAPYLRRSFNIDRGVVRATAYVTARGLYEFRLNGSRVGDRQLAPGWTDYSRRIQYQTYDVTELLHEGENVAGAIIGDGWYAGYVGFDPKRRGAHYGKSPRLLVQVVIEFADGTKQIVSSDERWRSAAGPVLYSDLLVGESYDARREMEGWDSSGFDDSAWRPVVSEPLEASILEAQPDQGVRVTEGVAAKSVREVRDGIHVVDLGQNMVGRVRLRARGEPGTTIIIRHGEAVNEDGSLYTTNLRSARQEDVFTLRGGGEEIFEPRFTFHGFRYVEITGYPGELRPEDIAGRVLHSDTPPTGRFECSSELVNQLQSNIWWGQKGNFLSIPTDCPQRDERLGWTGDAQVFVRTAAFNMEVAAFFRKWLRDLEDAQSEEGAFPDVTPLLDFGTMDLSQGAPAWGDAGIIVPWAIYASYGDRRTLERYYPAMRRWMDYLLDKNPSLLRCNALGNNYGDWLSPGGAETPRGVLATAYWAYDARLISRIAQTLGHDEDAARYGELFERIARAFNEAYVGSDGSIKGDTQTCYVLALHMDLLPEEQRESAAEHLVRRIRDNDWHLSTGFVGVSYLCPVLTEFGYTDVAYRLLLNETYPSWGYTIRNGATTIWERWDGWTEENGFQSPKMNSFNHYSLGSVGEWMYRYVAGLDLDPEGPGYRRLRIQPHPGGGLTHARAEYDSVRGKISSAWETDGESLRLDISVPANVTANVYVPADGEAPVTESDALAHEAEGIKHLCSEEGKEVFEVGSGDYSFVSQVTIHALSGER